MRLKAGIDVLMEVSAPCPLVAMLRPRSGQAQWIQRESYLLEPSVGAVEYVDPYGNLCQRILAPVGELRIRVEVLVETADDIATDHAAPAHLVQDLPDEVLQFLLPSRYCPADKLGGIAQEVAGQVQGGYAQVQTIERWIHQNITYKYGVSNASTDASETLNVRAGVCRDFAHVGLSLCRGLGIPARMVVGYLYELDPMDMHAWFEAYLGGRWYTFDATQEQPKGGRVVVAYGRDAVDVAFISEYGPLQTKNMKVWVERA